MLNPARQLLRVLEVLAWAAFLAFALILLSLRYWILPRAENYREDLVHAISASIGLPVKIGAIATDWQGLRPKLSIADVRIYDRDGREALVLPNIENVVSWRSLLAFDLRLYSFVVDGLKLSVRRDANGVFYVAGIRLADEKGDGKLGNWILSQNEIVIRDAEVEWIDESRNAPPLRLSALNLRLQNDGDEHAFGVRARPPHELGPGVEVRALLNGRNIQQPENWAGRVYAELGATDLAGWRAWVNYPLEVQRGDGALRLWATLSAGKLTHATADVALANVSARLGKDLPMLEMTEVRGRVYGRLTVHGYDFGARGLALTSPGAPPMNSTSFHASWEPASATGPQLGQLSANLIELGPLAHLAEFLPFPADLRKLLADLSPQGNLLDLKFEWRGTLPDEASYTAHTRFSGLTMNSWRSIPGIANLSGSVDANQKKGMVTLLARRGEIDLPKLFPEPRIRLDSLSGEVSWEREAPGVNNTVAVKLKDIAYSNADITGTASGSYLWTGEGPGVVDLTAQLGRVDGRSTAKYLPLSTIMGARTREWVAAAVQGGQATDARVRLRGDLRDFPFLDPAKGIFEINANISGAVLDYAEGWPRITAIEGRLGFDRERIEIQGNSGNILGARISNVNVVIPSLRDAHPHLTVDGFADGPTQEFLDFIRQSPVRRMVGGATEAMSATGRGSLHLRLDLPLKELSQTKVEGEYQLQANSLLVDARLPAIERASGMVRFTESGITLPEIRGQLFGEQVRIFGGTRPDAGVVITAEGRATVEGIKTLFDHPWRRRLSGAARYIATVTAKDGRVQVSLESQLEGIASALPAPLSKSAADPLPLRIDIFPGDGRDRISVQVGRIIAAEFLRAGQGGAMQVQRSLITLNPVTGETMRVPERRGTTVRGALPALDLERWLPLFAEGGGGSADGATFDLKIGILDAIGRRMRNVSMQGVTDATGWSASMSTAEFAGDVVYRNEASGRLVARFSRFSMPEDGPGAKPGETNKDLPAVDIVAESFTHRGRKFGRVEVQARHEGKDWRIDKINVTNPDATFAGTGVWKQGEASRTTFNFKLDVNDVGKFLDRMGYGEHVKGGHSTLEGSVNWGGEPVNLDYATLGGTLSMKAEDGQFLEIEPGVGKLVSLMSLQMLPRRLSLDFRDVFSKGFQFDRITSSLNIERGTMATKDFHMNGPAADVYINGQIDLSLETQNLKVKVIPQLGDTASTVVGLVNPFAGVATLIAGRMMKNPLGKLFAFDYTVSGTWTDPKVEKVQPIAIPTPGLDPNGILNR
jgi:uncharacterized protein (TIGR02099 family)